MQIQATATPKSLIEQLPIDRIYASPHQMRKHFDKAALRDLAHSMKQEGLIQPITVRKIGSSYELVVGERRLRAAHMLGWKIIDARVIDISDEDAAVKGLIENLQRADLSPIEEAKGYKQLVEPPYNLTQNAISERVGKSQTAVARALALLELAPEIQALMPRGIITESHTRSIRKISDRFRQIEIARQAHRQGWTVKETERRVNDVLSRTGESPKRREGGKKFFSDDPLAGFWEPILKRGDLKEVKVSAVRYEGSGRWTLRIETSEGAPPRQALSEFFVHLGNTLAGPIPTDIIDSDK